MTFSRSGRWAAAAVYTAILLSPARAQESSPGPALQATSPAPQASGNAVEQPEKTSPSPAQEPAAQATRTSLNLLGQTNTAGGEARRNENVQINLVDTNAARELNRRVGVTATLVPEFRPDQGYFASEYGGAPRTAIHAAPQRGSGVHGNVFFSHNNSAFSARSFFQVGGVRPARTNQFGATIGASLSSNTFFTLSGTREPSTGQVNGNVLIPLPEERTPLTNDPILRPLIQKLIDGYPDLTPNRPDIAARSLNTNAPQRLATNTLTSQITQRLKQKDSLTLRYAYTLQSVEAFQLIRGSNPNSRNGSHGGRFSWNRAVNARTVLDATLGFDRQTTNLSPTADAPITTTVAGYSLLGPNPTIPLNRILNRYRAGASFARQRNRHAIMVGAAFTRLQYNGYEDETSRGIFQFRNDFGRDAFTNFRLGTASSYTLAPGTTYRGFRNWETQVYAGDRWTVNNRLTLNYSVRWEPITRPNDVTGRSELQFDSDWNNVGGSFGFAYRLPNNTGVVRAAYGLMFGQIYPATYGMDRWNKPYSFRVLVQAPNLANPLGTFDIANPDLSVPTTNFLVSSDLATPYSHQYNFIFERELGKAWRLQMGYVGSRSHKLYGAYLRNRAQPVAGIPFTTATINQRRAAQDYLEQAFLNNTGRAYYDAARVTVSTARWRGLSLVASYWFSKSIDLGSDYNATGAALDSRRSGAQTEFENHKDMKALSTFDQPHALLIQSGYDIPRWKHASALTRNWSLTAVWLLKSGTPFTVDSGSDGPGFGNVDGTVGDRVSLVDPSVLGRTVGNPDTSRQLLPRQAFRFMNAPIEMAGNLGRNTFRKGKIANANIALQRNWNLGHDWLMSLRAESINFFNTPQFAEPGVSLSTPNFGQITNTLNDGRTFRFQLRILF